jgi:uncharacterized OB-fold protein
MTRWVRAAAYRPAVGADGRRVAARDEDDLTLLATALERAEGETDLGPGPVEVALVGTPSPGVEPALPALLGRPVTVLRAGAGAAAFAAALERASVEARAGSRLVLAVDLGRAAGPGTPGDDGAVAYLFGPSPSPEAMPDLSGLDHEPTALAAARRLFHERQARSLPVDWVGDWEVPASASLDGAGVEYPEAVLQAVSEGAYVPPARYLENLASRWRLIADECGACGTVGFPARGRCRRCGREDGVRRRRLPRDRALVVATTAIGSGGQPTEFDFQVAASGPYSVVLAERAPGIRVTMQVTDARPGAIRIGDRIDTRLRRLYPMEGAWRYGRKAVPRRATGAGEPA